MEKQQFKAESKRLLDLMINSIYTHQEIFLREIISNASDAIDKLAYTALTDEGVGLNRDDFAITVTRDKDNSTITVSDNGIGMNRSEMEENLGTIAKSGSLGCWLLLRLHGGILRHRDFQEVRRGQGLEVDLRRCRRLHHRGSGEGNSRH